MVAATIAIIDYGSGNLRSCAKAFELQAAEGDRVVVTNAPEEIARASHIVLPGVGAFADCMHGLMAVNGLRQALEQKVLKEKTPFLGICVGMQMLFDRGYEHGTHAGLGWIAGEVIKIESTGKDAPLKIPHMGWNDLAITQPDHPLLAGIPAGSHAYFVHSYHAVCERSANVLARVEYGAPLTAIVGHENIMGTQFHPEKSQSTGLGLLHNFIRLGR